MLRRFTTSARRLDAVLVSGTRLAATIKKQIAQKVIEYNREHRGVALPVDNLAVRFADLRFKPQLTIVQVGLRPDSSAYVRQKLKAAAVANIELRLLQLPEDTSEEALLDEIARLNHDPAVHGLLVQLPLPAHVDETLVTNAVAAEKDVDGFHRHNAGELSKRGGRPLFTPCTPTGIVELIRTTGVALRGKLAVVLGRLDIVGTPVAAMLRNEDCTVTICHRHTAGLADVVRGADIVVAAVGIPEYVQGSWVKPGAVVVDVGINYVERGGRRQLVGDVDHAAVARVAGHLTPVPGGVGPMTVAMLCSNVYDAAVAHEKRARRHRFRALPLRPARPVPLDIAISRAQRPKPIGVVARELGLVELEFEPYGRHKAKVHPKRVAQRLAAAAEGPADARGHYVLVAGITPTPLGEGKSTTTVGLAQALGAHLGLNAIANVRQPSMGPTFGVKGGAAGGGYAQVVPMDEFNMHLTGDIHAISAAQNLLCAAVDTRMFHEATSLVAGFYARLVPRKNGRRRFTALMLKRLDKLGIAERDPDALGPADVRRFALLDIDPASVAVKRVVDCNDRFLREVTLGQAPTEAARFPPRALGFDITVACELMAILALSTSLHDLRTRVGKIVVGTLRAGAVVTAEDVGAAGAVTALLKDAFKPNLMQTLEGTPVFVHAGPFANISIGALLVVADRLALQLTLPLNPANAGRRGFVVTEAGFDFTMGGERFFNIKCRALGVLPDAVVLVATLRALKLHGGAPDVKPGQELPPEYTTENVDLVTRGCANLAKQIANARRYGARVVVAVNEFESDTKLEIQAICDAALAAGADAAVPSNHWALGGLGALQLAEAVVGAVRDSKQQFLYPLDMPVEEKLATIAREMYGAKDIELAPLARKQIDAAVAQGYGHLPVCIAKTQYSLSHDPKLKGVPTGFTVPIREVRLSAGAGYLYALAAEIMTIPGLPTHSGFMNVEVNEDEEIEGLF